MSWRSRKRSSEDDNTSGDHNTPGTGNPNETADSNSENPVSPVHDVVDRLLEVFAWHGIQQPEIPKFLTQFDGPRVSFGDLSSKERLLERLDDAILDFTQELFALDQNWLRRNHARRVLRSRNFYKSVEHFPRFLLVNSVRKSGEGLWFDSHFSDYRRPSGMLYFFSHKTPSTETTADDTGEAVRWST